MESAAVLFNTISVEIMDGVACALLAASASARARALGASFSGAIALGCICGLLCPLLRETFLHGQIGASMVIRALPDDAFIGAFLGELAPVLPAAIRRLAFFCFDSIGMSFAGALCAILGMNELGIVGSLALGLCASLAPGLVRDVALGDIAMLVERNWYAAAAALSCMTALTSTMLIMLYGYDSWLSSVRGEASIVLGAVAGFAIRFWKDEKIEE